jgi:hypothetical protein
MIFHIFFLIGLHFGSTLHKLSTEFLREIVCPSGVRMVKSNVVDILKLMHDASNEI